MKHIIRIIRFTFICIENNSVLEQLLKKTSPCKWKAQAQTPVLIRTSHMDVSSRHCWWQVFTVTHRCSWIQRMSCSPSYGKMFSSSLNIFVITDMPIGTLYLTKFVYNLFFSSSKHCTNQLIVCFQHSLKPIRRAYLKELHSEYF